MPLRGNGRHYLLPVHMSPCGPQSTGDFIAFFVFASVREASSETQGQLVGPGKSLNGRGKKIWAKNSQEGEEFFFTFLTFLSQT